MEVDRSAKYHRVTTEMKTLLNIVTPHIKQQINTNRDFYTIWTSDTTEKQQEAYYQPGVGISRRGLTGS